MKAESIYLFHSYRSIFSTMFTIIVCGIQYIVIGNMTVNALLYIINILKKKFILLF